MTNKGLEDEIRPIMGEFKVRLRFVSLVSPLPAELLAGSRDVRGMFRKNTSERLRGIPLRPEGCPPSNGSTV